MCIFRWGIGVHWLPIISYWKLEMYFFYQTSILFLFVRIKIYTFDKRLDK